MASQQPRLDVDAVLHAQNTPESRFVLAHRRLVAERATRGVCRFGCAERAEGPDPYCPEHGGRRE